MTHSPPEPPISAADDDAPDEVMAPDTLQGPLPLAIVGFLVIVVIGGVTDLIMDEPASLWSFHVLFESLMVAISLGFAIYLYRSWHAASTRLRTTRESLRASERALEARQAERDAWRRSAEQALAGLSLAIDAQFDVWGLTRAEREVALLLLKGAGHKQAAAHLDRSERTVRQHAVEVYRKAGLQGRAELAAFFLADLMPQPATSPGG
ncbi:MAG: hypothetical protein IT355_03210 [Gemmatimonadaceae bacterium]|nr:hypothetical protein [Gemmatimonadaceae bacterium]